MPEKVNSIGFDPEPNKEEHLLNIIAKTSYYSPKRQYTKKDSLNISSYSVFLNKLGWKLKSIKFDKPRTLKLSFEVDELVIDYECDLDALVSTGSQFFVISRKFIDQKILIKLFFSLKKKNVKQFTSLERKKFNGLMKLFEQVINIPFNKELNIFSDTVNSKIFIDLNDEIMSDFEYIIFVIFRLIQELGQKIPTYEKSYSDKFLFEKIVKEELGNI